MSNYCQYYGTLKQVRACCFIDHGCLSGLSFAVFLFCAMLSDYRRVGMGDHVILKREMKSCFCGYSVIGGDDPLIPLYIHITLNQFYHILFYTCIVCFVLRDSRLDISRAIWCIVLSAMLLTMLLM